MRHGDRPHNYVSNYIFGFAISSGLTKILPIEKCIIFFRHPVCTTLLSVLFLRQGTTSPSHTTLLVSHLSIFTFVDGGGLSFVDANSHLSFVDAPVLSFVDSLSFVDVKMLTDFHVCRRNFTYLLHLSMVYHLSTF